ncbi:enoyl-CoA hydratase domain-containing protein 3, mitochondrial-like [Saccoglossus kowalevskii]|uniref:Enoyl-CoA hydratase domain-containing protein 3, mitochondrial n=1 Tax=Saccoglossus kowalevskii TaxID=10224 RepID=A0ABM0N184_SACKO|nr:PREDICTED: enoyl-CoA hydratase domain-containing protein 3, mitochondrial-like [Saccoglossus kowalevskii]
MALSTLVLRTFCRGISTNIQEFIPVSSYYGKHIRLYSDAATKQRDEPYTIRTQKDGIRTIFLNDIKKRNALSLAMLESLKSDLLHEIESDDLRVIIISSSGPAFSSGHDLKELTMREGRDYHTKVFNTCSDTMKMIKELPVPVIAQVQGLATAAGCQLVASCDIAIAAENSTFATPGVNIGLFCSTPAVAIGRAIPQKVAMEMLFTGKPIDAQAALKHGLVSKIVPKEKLEEETMAVARQICKSSRAVIALGKSCFYHQITKDLSDAYRQASEIMVFNLDLKDGQEGINAFIEKREPSWSHEFTHVNENE